ncbi:unnamed protein product [Effrenium voratum]|nr:unnamed protein product [Effrenium voratum]
MACIVLLALTDETPIFQEVYSFIELFGGTAWVSRCMKSAGHAVASFDILYGHPKPNKQDCMDLLTDAGFTLALLCILNCRLDGFHEYEKQLDLLMEKKKALEATPEELARASAPRLPPKRLREKVHDPDPEGQVAALKEANLKMQKELEALRKMSGSATPSPKMCELKPSGRLNVPEPIHEAWKNGSTAEREDMIATLDECGWRKEDFVKRVIKSREKVARKSAKKKRGWYSTEGMAKKLSWSGSYIKGVVKFCEKKGNEHLTKKDKYNKNITKYYVEYEEDDESADELEERERQEEIEATGVCQGTSTCQRFPYLFASWVLALCFFVRLASL